MNNLEKEFVPYTEALELKQLQFDEPCLAYYLLPEIERTGDILLHYCSRGKEIIRNNDWSWVYENFPAFRKYLKAEHCYTYSTNSSRLTVSAPTYSQAFRWFREKHNLEGEVHCIRFNSKRLKGYQYAITSENYQKFEQLGDYHTYEEAELACLNKLIEIVKN
jgi:hypothetical protein